MEISNSTRIYALVVFFLYSVLCIFLGNWQQKKERSGGFGKNFFAGGGDMHWLAAGLMVAAGCCSGGTFLSNPGLGHSWGLIWPTALIVSAFMGSSAAIVVSKKLHIVCERLNCVSIGAALKHRYGNSAFIGWYVPLAILIFDGLFLYQQVTSGAKLMQTVTGLSYVWGLVIFAAVLLFYSIFSGTRGASIVSIFQGAVMTVTAFAIIIGLVVAARGEFGSVANAFASLASTDSAYVLKPTGNFTIQMLGSYFIFAGFTMIAQKNAVQNAVRVKSSKAVHKQAILTVIFIAFWQWGLVSMGSLGRAVFPDAVSDTIIPFSAMATLPPVFVGICVAGVSSAIHSTLVVTLLNINATVVMDLYKEQIKKGNVTDKQLERFTRICTVLLIVLMVVIAIKPPALIGVINIFSVAGGACAFFLPVLMGLWNKRVNLAGCIASMVFGIGYYVLSQYVKTLQFGMNALVPSLAVALIAMVVATKLGPPPSDEVLDVWFGVGKSTHKA